MKSGYTIIQGRILRIVKLAERQRSTFSRVYGYGVASILFFHVAVNIGMTIVEPGGARTEFRYGSAQVANLMPAYAHVHGFLDMLDKNKGLAPGDPVKMAQRMIESVDISPAPLRMVLGSRALQATIERLEERLADYKAQTALAASTDIAE